MSDWRLSAPTLRKWRDKFLKHIANTNSPETFDTFDKDYVPTPDREFQPVTKFGVSGRNTREEYVWCNECKQRKFLDGGWLIYDENQHLSFIGPNCADKFYGIDRFTTNRDASLLAIDSEEANDGLLDAIAFIASKRNEATCLIALAKEADRCIKAIVNMDAQLKKKLKLAIKRDGGQLTVTDTRNVFDSKQNIRSEEYQKTVAKIIGYAVFEYKPIV